MIQAIFFDFNGVIIDDETLQLEAYREVLQSEGITITDENYFDSLGMDDEMFTRACFERAGIELAEEKMLDVIERKAARHGEMISGELPLFPGVATFVKALARKYPLGIVSMARRAEITGVLRRASLRQAFAVIVSAELVDACKPDPECYNRALEKLNEKRSEAHVLPFVPGECLVIEDSPPGILSARAAGMRTLGVANTVPEAALRAAGAEVVTHSLADWTLDAVHHVYDQG